MNRLQQFVQKRNLHIAHLASFNDAKKSIKNEKIIGFGMGFFVLVVGPVILYFATDHGAAPSKYFSWNEIPQILAHKPRRLPWFCQKCGLFQRQCHNDCLKEEKEKKEAYFKLTKQ